MNPQRAVPGMTIDSNGEFCLVVVSEEAVGVSIQRYDRMLQTIELHHALHSQRWMAVYRQHEGEIFVLSNNENEPRTVTAPEQESGHMAVEIALGVWPGWKPPPSDIKMRPKTFIPYAMKVIET